MNDIIEIAQKPEVQELCNRCLGRLFGKMGYGLDNPTRGRVLRLILALKDELGSMKPNTEQIDFNSLTDFIEAFKFTSQQMIMVGEIPGINHPNQNLGHTNKSNGKLETVDSSQALENDGQSNTIESIITNNLKPEIINDIENGKTSCKLCNGVFDELPKFTDLVCESIKDYELNDFLIGCKLDFDQTLTEEELWSKLGLMHPEPMKSEFNRELGKLVGVRIGKMVNFDTPDITILVDTRYDDISLQIASMFIYGRYQKFVRDIPQTKWPCKRCWGKGCENCNGTGKVYPTSVEEIIAKMAMEITSGNEHLFHGMGREDINVRMLGNGRPFILEITEPIKRNVDLEILEKQINDFADGRVKVSGLRISSNREVREIKSAKPSKTYNIKINFGKIVDKGNLKDIVSTFRGRIIEQRTPVRVSHRRADLIRKRKVLDMAVETISKNRKSAEIKLTGESGIYIKELITGDAGRTTPSLTGELGMECTVEELDVLQINDEN
jgi:tRNA pseudouridine synthase 10